jgi:putative glutamine amidotransferase
MHDRMNRPLILITTWRRPLPTFLGERTTLDTLDPAYADRVADAGGRPLLLSRSMTGEAAQLAEILAGVGGLVLTGGGDVDPASYGAARENVTGDDPVADRFELSLIEAARASALPTLAICRGAQLLAVAHGGRLAQRAPAAGPHTELGDLAADAILAARHPVTLTAGSRVARAFGDQTEVSVNTIHHHQIADPGELTVTATAPDGVIEAVEPRDGWACVGVQWHPEKMQEPEQRGLFDRLIADARSGALRRAAPVSRRAA